MILAATPNAAIAKNTAAITNKMMTMTSMEEVFPNDDVLKLASLWGYPRQTWHGDVPEAGGARGLGSQSSSVVGVDAERPGPHGPDALGRLGEVDGGGATVMPHMNYGAGAKRGTVGRIHAGMPTWKLRECPKCGAPPGHSCTRAYGRDEDGDPISVQRLKNPHEERRKKRTEPGQ